MSPTAKLLAKFNTVEEIEGFQRAILAAKYEKVSVNIVINASARGDGRASSGINLADESAQDQFLADCEGALAILNEETTGQDAPHHFDFSRRPVRV